MVSHEAEPASASFRHLPKRLLLRRARASFGRDWHRGGAGDGVTAAVAVAAVAPTTAVAGDGVPAAPAVAAVAPTTAVAAPSTPETVSSCIFRGSSLIREEEVRKYTSRCR